MIHTIEPMLEVAAAGAPFANIKAFKVRARWQNDVSKLCFTFHPDGLVDDTLDALVPVGGDHPAGFSEGPEGGAAVFVDHVNTRVARHRIAVGCKLDLRRHTVPQVARGLAFEDGFGKLLPWRS